MSPYIWLAVAAIAAIVEAVSFGLITMWFVIGALVAFAIAFAGGPLWLQLVAFAVISVACLVLLRPVILKYRKRGEAHEATPVGSKAIVVEDVDNAALRGRVETPDHMTWAAISADQSIIPSGTRVRVVGQQSIKLVVEKAE
jgi:membrane protein implicated in regulation of membrane protease activity